MSYIRKMQDTERLKKLAEKNISGFYGSFFDRYKQRYVRVYKGGHGRTSDWSTEKKIARRRCRRFANKHGFYTKKAHDLYWIVY